MDESSKYKTSYIDDYQIRPIHCAYLRTVKLKRYQKKLYDHLNNQASNQLQCMKLLTQKLIKEEGTLNKLAIAVTHVYLLREQIKIQKEIISESQPLLQNLLNDYIFLVTALEGQRRKFVLSGKQLTEEKIDALMDQMKTTIEIIQNIKQFNWKTLSITLSSWNTNQLLTADFINAIIQCKNILYGTENQVMEESTNHIANTLNLQ